MIRRLSGPDAQSVRAGKLAGNYRRGNKATNALPLQGVVDHLLCLLVEDCHDIDLRANGGNVRIEKRIELPLG